MTNKLTKYFEAVVFDDLTETAFEFNEISYFSINDSKYVGSPETIEYEDCNFKIYPTRLLSDYEKTRLDIDWRVHCPV
jgi:hypothetical protein